MKSGAPNFCCNFILSTTSEKQNSFFQIIHEFQHKRSLPGQAGFPTQKGLTEALNSTSRLSGLQSSPPFMGGGLVQDRDLVC